MSFVIILAGCEKSDEKSKETSGALNNTEESIEDKAIASYEELLKDAKAIDIMSDLLYDASMDYEQNLSIFGKHYDTYAFYDINQDEVPEMIATSMINNRWTQVYVYTYKDGKAVLLSDETNSMTHCTFDQNATANGSYSIAFCGEKHIHSIWRGTNPIGEEVEENFAYTLEGTTLKSVECEMKDSDSVVYYSNISKVNDLGEATIKDTTSEDTNAEDANTDVATKKDITIDYYKVPELYSKFVTEEDMTAFRDVVAAWLNYEPKVKVNNPSNQDKLWGMLKECFFLIYSDFDEDRGLYYDQEYIYFPYETSSKEEHDAIIAEFEERVQSFYEGIGEDEEGVELAKHIYINFNKTISYNYDVVENDNYTFKNTSGYTALMEGSGVCMSFARAYSYLVRQAGLECFCVSGLSGNSYIDAHEWSALKVGDKYYFADPTWDYKYNPANYTYFCFGVNQREDDGYPEEFMNVCENGNLKMSDYVYIERDNMN